MAPMNEDDEELFVTTTEIDGRPYSVTATWDFEGVRDHGSIPGRTREDIQEAARGFTNHELTLRHRRAISERRRFSGLRQVTQEVLAQIRYLNKVATSMRAGLLDVDEAATEIANTEERLHDMIGQLRLYAGVAN